MEAEDHSIAEVKNRVTQVTPLSKYLAMFLFVLLPFVGGWIGYVYAPVKVLETERIVYKEAEPIADETDTAVSVEEKILPHEERMKRIEELRSDPSLKIDDINDLQAVISFAERKDMYAAARRYVAENSVSGMEFSLVFNWKKGDWVHFSVIPENVVTDNAQLYIREESGQWILEGFGTAFPGLYEQHPELFKE